MAAGEIVHGHCIPSASKVDVVLSHLLPGASQQGSDSYTWWFYKASSSEIGKITTINGTLYQDTVFSVATYPACDTTEQFFDGMAIGWLVVGAMVAAFSIHLLRRALT